MHKAILWMTRWRWAGARLPAPRRADEPASMRGRN
jgi:hypothetical protein